MQIGKGKQGVIIGEYGGGNGRPDTNPTIGWIEPACDNPQWILWFSKNGDAQLYTRRGPTGEVLSERVIVKAQRCVGVRGFSHQEGGMASIPTPSTKA